MYVCICHAVTDRDIEEAVQSGVSEFHELVETLKVSTCCGTCREAAAACLESCVERDGSTQAA